MKFKPVFLVLFILLLSFQAVLAQSVKRKLVWSDEFNYKGLPKSKKWDYEHGYIRNVEKQYYTKARKENAYVHNGYLEIKAIKEQISNEFYQKGSEDWKKSDSLTSYTSACLITEGKASWSYGRIEVRAKLPAGLGVWPAIWMLGANRKYAGWPKCGEIDIMEFVGVNPDKIYGTVHYPKDENGGHSSSGGTIDIAEKGNDFHIYAIELKKDSIEFYYDNQCYHRFAIDKANLNGAQPFNKPFYLLINLALGGSWAGKVDDNNLPQHFLIDYVRVYE